MSLKMLDGNDLPHELLLTTRQKNEAKKCILAPLGITAAALATDAGIFKKIHGSGTTNSITSNKEWMT